MKKVIRLTESDLLNIVKRVISEQETQPAQPSDNNFIQQKYNEFTNLLSPAVKQSFIKQYPVQDAITELQSCKPSKFDNFKTKMEGLKQQLKSFVSGSDLTKNIQSISSFFEKNPNVNEQAGVVVLSGLAMLLLVSMYKSFLFFHGYVPSKSCMGQGTHLPYYIEGTVNLLRDLIHFDVHPFIGKPASGRERDKFNVKKHQKALKNIDKEYNRQQRQQASQEKLDANRERVKQANTQREQQEYINNFIKYFENYVEKTEGVKAKNYIDIDTFTPKTDEFFDNSPYPKSDELVNYLKKYYKIS